MTSLRTNHRHPQPAKGTLHHPLPVTGTMTYLRPLLQVMLPNSQKRRADSFVSEEMNCCPLQPCGR